MRVPQAREALQEIRERSPGVDTWNREVTNILESLWLQAYEEGEAKVFGSPAKKEKKMKTWNVIDARGNQHQVIADSYWYTTDGDIHFIRDENTVNRDAAFFSRPVAVTESVPHLIDNHGTDFGEIEDVDWRDGHFMVYMKKET